MLTGHVGVSVVELPALYLLGHFVLTWPGAQGLQLVSELPLCEEGEQRGTWKSLGAWVRRALVRCPVNSVGLSLPVLCSHA